MPGFRRLLGQIYIQVLIAVVIGAVLGVLFPQFGSALKPVADGFIKLIKMLLAPIVFGTVVVGMARMSSLREVGRSGVKAPGEALQMKQIPASRVRLRAK